MKKLKKFVLNPTCHSLDANAMTNIVGGVKARITSCSTSCSYGPPLEIIGCNGDCISKDGQYVACIGPTQQLWKYC